MRHKKKIIALVTATTLATGGYYISHKKQVVVPPSPPAPIVSDVCAGIEEVWKFVYHPARLKILEKCIIVEGILINAVQEKDGDYHGRLQVSDQTLVNQDNVIGQYGYLVLENICQGWTTQPDAIQPCQGYDGPIINLQDFIGKKVRVTGSFVQDTQHNKGNGGWLELHPLISIEEIK